MFLTFEDRPSWSPFIERVWRCRGGAGGRFLSMAEGVLELVVTRLPGLTRVTLRGPVTRAIAVDCPPGGHWVAIRFSPGTYLPRLPTVLLLDHNDLELPVTADGRFWMEGGCWEIPGFETAEVFVARLVRQGSLARDPAVAAAVAGDPQPLGRRSVQRRFRHATGLTPGQFRQIERARHAAQLLEGGAAILDVAYSTGYADQAHLTRSLTRLIGQTPLKIQRRAAQLSFSFKTEQAGPG